MAWPVTHGGNPTACRESHGLSSGVMGAPAPPRASPSGQAARERCPPGKRKTRQKGKNTGKKNRCRRHGCGAKEKAEQAAPPPLI